MKLDKYKTDVVFRIDTTNDWKGTIFALFPHSCCDYQGNVSTYQFIGQHSAANYGCCIQTSRPATKKEYAELKKHLRNHYGYNLNVVKRQNRQKYLDSYHELIKN